MTLYTPSLEIKPTLALTKKPLVKEDFSSLIEDDYDNSDSGNSYLTIAVVAYNERDQLIALIEKLLSITVRQRTKILVVDNGLDDDIVNMIRQHKLHYVRTRYNLGCSWGRNLASALTTTELISFIDADGIVHDDYVVQCFSAMDDKKVVCARGKVAPLSEGGNAISSYDMGSETIPCPPTAEGISVWRTLDFKKAGGFENDLYGGEGIVLCYRMIELLGYKRSNFIYFPKLVLLHDFDKSSAHLEKKLIRNFINRRHIDLKYPLLERMLREFNADVNSLGVTKGNNQQSNTFNKINQHARSLYNQMVSEYEEKTIAKRLKQKDKPKSDGYYNFTVVIPCYNLGAYLDKAIESVYSQTLDHIEVIVVDDVSTDPETIRILKRLESNVKVLYRKKNGGASAARNLGISNAKSEYILCLDADDTISSTYLEEAFNVFEIDPDAGIVCSYVKQIGESTVPWYPADNVGVTVDTLISSPSPSASCFRKKAWDQTGGYDEQLRGMEDWEFWLNILSRGWKQRSIPRSHFIYLNRKNSKAKTSDKNSYDIVAYIANKHINLYTINLIDVVAKNAKLRKHAQAILRDTNSENIKLRQEISRLKVTQGMGLLERNRRRFTKKIQTAKKIVITEKRLVYAVQLAAINFRKLRKSLRSLRTKV